MWKSQSIPSVFASIATFQRTVVSALLFNLFVCLFVVFVAAFQWTAVNMLFRLLNFFFLGAPIRKPIHARSEMVPSALPLPSSKGKNLALKPVGKY